MTGSTDLDVRRQRPRAGKSHTCRDSRFEGDLHVDPYTYTHTLGRVRQGREIKGLRKGWKHGMVQRVSCVLRQLCMFF